MQKILHTIFLLAVMSSRLFAVEHDSDSLNDLTADLRAAIPEGWKVSINRFDDDDDGSIHIEVWRAKEVQFFRSIPPNSTLGGPEQPNPPEFFYFNFYLTDYLSPKGHARLTTENAAIEARLAEYTKAMTNVKRHGKSRAYGDTRPLGYYPETENEKKRLQEFVDYTKSHPKHHIPQDYHYQKMSFHFFDPRNIQQLKSKEIDTECTKVLKSILKVFRSY